MTQTYKTHVKNEALPKGAVISAKQGKTLETKTTSTAAAGADNLSPIPDAHIHLHACNIRQTRPCIAVTCTPAEFAQACKSHKSTGLGLHPWQVNEQTAPALLEAFFEQLPKTRIVGEIGLDFYKEFAQSACVQLDFFKSICGKLTSCPYLLSLHSRKAEREVLDILEQTKVSSHCTCILHAYNGPADQLQRALKMGCLISFGLRELKIKRGREYARQLPAQRILLETDADGTSPFDSISWNKRLEDALTALSVIKGCDMRAQIADNFRHTTADVLE